MKLENEGEQWKNGMKPETDVVDTTYSQPSSAPTRTTFDSCHPANRSTKEFSIRHFPAFASSLLDAFISYTLIDRKNSFTHSDILDSYQAGTSSPLRLFLFATTGLSIFQSFQFPSFFLFSRSVLKTTPRHHSLHITAASICLCVRKTLVLVAVIHRWQGKYIFGCAVLRINWRGLCRCISHVETPIWKRRNWRERVRAEKVRESHGKKCEKPISIAVPPHSSAQ